VLNYRDLWNWVGSEYLFTVPSFFTPRWPGWTIPRGRLRDEEPDYEDMPFDSPQRFAPAKTESELAITRAFSAVAYTPGGPEGWTLNEAARHDLRRGIEWSVPGPLRARTLVMLSRNSPHYRRLLTPEEQARDDLAYRDTLALWREAGIAAAEYGRDFAPEDFGDRTHLSVTGGRKLAGIVAREIKTLARQLGYPTEATP
jgi:hypothetical protein